MSHFTTIRVQIFDGSVLQESLLALGHSVETNSNVRGYQGSQTYADYVIRQANGFDVGFRKQGDTYELVGDFWGATLNPQRFINTVTQMYAHKLLLKTAQEQGFVVEDQETLADGTVRLVVGRWV